MDLANGCAGDGLLLAKVGFWCQSFLLNLEALEALESLEARNCDANFPKKTVLLKVLEELFHRFAQVFLALSGST